MTCSADLVLFLAADLMPAEPEGMDRPLTDALHVLEVEVRELMTLLDRVSQSSAVAAIVTFGFAADFKAAARGLSDALAGTPAVLRIC